MSYTYEYPHPAVTVDVVILTIQANELSVLLIRRGQPPFEGQWAIPGGFVNIDESLKRAAWRELKEETGVNGAFLQQLGAFGHPDRDPRERIITVAYFALIPATKLRPRAGSDASDARLFPYHDLPEPLAADHSKILRRTIERVRQQFGNSSLALQLLPDTFTMAELQEVYRCVLDRQFDKRNFQKHIKASGIVAATGDYRRGAAHRPAQLFRRSPGKATPGSPIQSFNRKKP